MTEVAITTETKKPNKFAMAISFLLALPLAAVLLIHPAMMLDVNGGYSHSSMMYIMIGISGGFIHGVGFIPKFWLWKWLFSPFLAWPLMLWGYYTWLLA
ncbi:cytochrome bd biosynthesis protein [Acinetobacter sp. ANC 4779]|uniref:cyd operon YbgE family protein n=1 Tax=Acinetobacter sp. ANC 4779 TaxID=2529848 RepID=UPI00103BA181|nr:cyd operon YbgE family protein [Acinetobacter sp. ANC 4779]TCB48774.1 cytochrome bd biosynthesis protein [Acinetobacter sp. ANC 4779]